VSWKRRASLACVGRRGRLRGLRNKHRDHWKPFDRKNSPAWMQTGQTGVDDKREFRLDRRPDSADLSAYGAADVYIEPKKCA
jgi:hypothetical protein